MIFEYSNYLDFLKDYYKEKCTTQGLSLRRFALFLEIDHSVLSRVLKGERKMPLNMAEGVAKKLKLNPLEIEYFMLLVECEHVNTIRAKSFFKNEIRNIQVQRALPKMEEEVFEIVADLVSFCILEMIDMKKFPNDSAVMAKLLRTSEERVEKSLKDLLDNKIIKRDESNRYKKISASCNFKINTSNSVIENYFRDILDKAKEELDTGTAQRRIYRTRIVAIPESLKPEICTMIDSFLGKLHLATESSDQEKDNLVCLNLNFFDMLDQTEVAKSLHGTENPSPSTQARTNNS